MRKPRPKEVEDLAGDLGPIKMAEPGFRPPPHLDPEPKPSTPSPGLASMFNPVPHFPEAPPRATLSFAFFGEAAEVWESFCNSGKILLGEEPGTQKNGGVNLGFSA